MPTTLVQVSIEMDRMVKTEGGTSFKLFMAYPVCSWWTTPPSSRPSGTHQELLAAGGRYAELFELQGAGYRP